MTSHVINDSCLAASALPAVARISRPGAMEITERRKPKVFI